MTRLVTSPAEVAWNSEGWSRLSSGMEVVLDTTTPPQQGSGSYIVGGDGLQKNSWIGLTNGVSGGFLYFQFYIRASALPISKTLPASPYIGSSAAGPQFHFDSSGRIDGVYFISGGSNEDADPSPLVVSAATWLKVEMVTRANPANSKRLEAWTWINGVFLCRSTLGSSTLAGEMTRFMASAASTYTPQVNVDDIKINDESSGSNYFFPSGVHPELGTAPSAGGAHTVPSVRSQAVSGTGAGATSTTFAATAPATIVAGDLLVAVVIERTNSTTITAPAGWTKKRQRATLPGSTFTIAYFEKVATAGDVGASTYTFSGSGAANKWLVHLASVQNASTIGDNWEHGGAGTAGTVATTPSLYDHSGDCLAMFGVANYKSASNVTLTGYPGANDQLAFDDSGSTSNFTNMKVGTRQQVAGGFSKGDGTSTISNNTSETHLGWQLLVKPSTGPTPPTIGQMWPRGWKDTSSPTTGQLFPRRVIA